MSNVKIAQSITTEYYISQAEVEKLIIEKFKLPKKGSFYFPNYSKGKVQYKTLVNKDKES